MRERADSKPRHPDTPNRKGSVGKKWRKVYSGSHPNDLKGLNQTIEGIYHSILRTTKELYLEPHTRYFERDYKYDGSESLTLHSFVSDQVYLRLECDYHCDMRIEYHFHNFPYEDMVLKLLHYMISRGSAFHKPQEPDLPAFFKRVVAYQDAKYTHSL